MEMKYIDRQDPDYPCQLRPYARMPERLYVVGVLPDPSVPSVAIVGARNCTQYGYQEAFRFGKVLAQNGVQIISGMALGCDAAGHEGALAGGGRTFAVLGCGADVCYPFSNRHLYRAIPEQGGGIISEFEPGVKPVGWHFPIRNRIISAFADIVLVAEARQKSGSLITVEYALEQGKTVYAIPGRNRDPASEGCNGLVAQGAGIATSPELLLEELRANRIRPDMEAVPGQQGNRGLTPDVLNRRRNCGQAPDVPDRRRNCGQAPDVPNRRRKCGQAPDVPEQQDNHDPDMRAIAEALDFDEKSAQMLAEQTGCTFAEAGACLIRLCAKGYAKEILPGYFCRI